MSEQKYTLGNVMALATFVSDNSGSWIELNIGNHRGAGLLVCACLRIYAARNMRRQSEN